MYIITMLIPLTVFAYNVAYMKIASGVLYTHTHTLPQKRCSTIIKLLL